MAIDSPGPSTGDTGHCRGLVGSWHCDNGPYGGFYTISASYADDWTKETTRDSLLLCSVARRGSVGSRRPPSTELGSLPHQ